MYLLKILISSNIFVIRHQYWSLFDYPERVHGFVVEGKFLQATDVLVGECKAL